MKYTTALLSVVLSVMLYACGSPAFAAPSLNWKDMPRKEFIVTGSGTVSQQFTTTKSDTYRGYFGAAADSSSGNLTRRMWISEQRGGKPVKSGKGRCSVSGVEPKLSWSQEDRPAYASTCKLQRGKQYWLNHSQSAFGGGGKPPSSARMIRSSSTGGKP